MEVGGQRRWVVVVFQCIWGKQAPVVTWFATSLFVPGYTSWHVFLLFCLVPNWDLLERALHSRVMHDVGEGQFAVERSVAVGPRPLPLPRFGDGVHCIRDSDFRHGKSLC